MTTAVFDPFASSSAMLAALRKRQVSAVELLDAHLDRIARLNPVLNAIVSPDFDNARHAAAEADAARLRGEDAPLLGLPLTLKDTIDVRGLPTTSGVLNRAAVLPAEDSPLAARVRRAGGVILGKTNIPPLAGDWQANNPVFGRSNNPWDLDRTPGGSTGGGAAALAAGLTPLEFGSDLGGSIRVPAAFCGVYGHRPSETALPRNGHFPGSPLPNAAVAMAVQGPLARSADDLALALDVVAGPQVGEEVGWRLVLPPTRHERLADFRVAVMPRVDFIPVDDAITAALEALATTLSRAGATVKQTAPTEYGDLCAYFILYLSLLAVITSIKLSPTERQAQVRAAEARGDDFSRARAVGLEASAADYLLWHGQREQYRAAYRAFFKEWDVLLAPVWPTLAFPHQDITIPLSARTLRVNSQLVPYSRGVFYPALGTLPGQPATAFPVGVSDNGLPIGLQAIGPYLEDYTPIRFAGAVAQERGGFQRPPNYDL